MNNKKLYIPLYYLSLLLTLCICIIPTHHIEQYLTLSKLSVLLIIINILLIIIFTVLLIKKGINKINILLPITYILFTIIVLIICILFNNKLVIPYIHYSYYIKFILINYILLNTYSLLSIKYKKK